MAIDDNTFSLESWNTSRSILVPGIEWQSSGRRGAATVLPMAPAGSDTKGGRHFVYRPGVDGK